MQPKPSVGAHQMSVKSLVPIRSGVQKAAQKVLTIAISESRPELSLSSPFVKLSNGTFSIVNFLFHHNFDISAEEIP